ncbi:MAG: hypothetical protein IJT91_00250 [Clostridia bacterium]|nr:hypothetical protein [Clostridia bacterium]
MTTYTCTKCKDSYTEQIPALGLASGAYTLCYLYDGWNLSEGMVTVTVD